MKRPFPGMDPYLETQGRWGDLRTSMITYCRDALNEVLPENYIAQIEVESNTIPLLNGDVEKIHDNWIEIRSLPELDLVTVVEILSPIKNMRRLDLPLEPKEKAWADQIATSAMGRTST